MNDIERFDALLDDLDAGEPVSDEDRRFLEEFRGSHPEQASEDAAWQEMLARLGDVHSPLSDEAMTSRVLQNAHAHRRSRSGIVLGLGLAAAAAAVLVLAWPSDRTASEDGAVARTRTAAAPSSTDRPSVPSEPHPTSDPEVSSPPGFSDPEGLLGPGGAPLAEGIAFTIERDGCFVLGGSQEPTLAQVCATSGTRFRAMSASTTSSRLSLEHGRLTAAVHHDRLPPGHRFTIETKVGSVTAVGTVFIVEVTESRTLARVEEGVVEVKQQAHVSLVHAGQEHVLFETRTANAPRKRPASAAPLAADEISRLAQQARAAGEFERAASLYRELVERHATSAEARVAQVQLGDLLLDKLDDPRGALRAYERYLKRGGTLAEEAAHGRIRALGRLGDRAGEEAAIRAFLERFPESFHASQLRARIER